MVSPRDPPGCSPRSPARRLVQGDGRPGAARKRRAEEQAKGRARPRPAVPARPPTQADLEGIRDRLAAGFAQVGFPIRSPVAIAVRAGLPPAATSFRGERGFVILVSDRALGGGHLELLLAHELAHVQRMDAGHPSHDDDAITAAYASVDARLEHGFQREILHHAINFTQDLYADPIGFRVVRALGLAAPAEIDALLAGFVNDEPYEIDEPLLRRWDRVEDMVGNARAITLARHADAPRARELAEGAQRRYLAKIAPEVAREAPWFQALFDGLPEDTTRERFTATLLAYVERFVATANGA
jgi:hypothetical protein